MPMFWVILCGVLFATVLLTKRLNLRGLAIISLPLIAAWWNITRQRKAQDAWFMRWPKFGEILLVQVMIIGIPASVGLITESNRGVLFFFWGWQFTSFQPRLPAAWARKKYPVQIIKNTQTSKLGLLPLTTNHPIDSRLLFCF